jgi:hypothetical protein
MNKVRAQIECLARLDELIATNTTIMDFLLAEDLMTREERKGLLASSDVAKSLQAFLGNMKGKQLQLLEYEWVLLPEERLKVTIITDRNNKEFSYNF